MSSGRDRFGNIKPKGRLLTYLGAKSQQQNQGRMFDQKRT